MIYEKLDIHSALRQGDIFSNIPVPYINIDRLPVAFENGIEEKAWKEISEHENAVVANIPLKRSWAIIASQDCDAARSPYISFFQIGKLDEVTRLNLPNSTKAWVSFITEKSRLNARWLYLPEDELIGFNSRMAVNFHQLFQISRESLINHIELRKGRLNKIAYEHYRESIAQYFRRYPYDEWYPMSKDEFSEYNKNKNVLPFNWQK